MFNAQEAYGRWPIMADAPAALLVHSQRCTCGQITWTASDVHNVGRLAKQFSCLQLSSSWMQSIGFSPSSWVCGLIYLGVHELRKSQHGYRIYINTHIRLQAFVSHLGPTPQAMSALRSGLGWEQMLSNWSTLMPTVIVCQHLFACTHVQCIWKGQWSQAFETGSWVTKA